PPAVDSEQGAGAAEGAAARVGSGGGIDHFGLAGGELLRARGIRPVWGEIYGPSLPAAAADAGGLGRLPAAEGLSGGVVSGNCSPDTYARARARAGSHHDPEHGAAASLDPWRAADDSRDRWRERSADHAGYRLSAYRHREDLRGQVLSPGGAAHRPHRLSLP